MGTYLNPFSDRILGKRAAQAPEPCNNPDILPIFEHAITPFYNDTDGRWLAVEKTPSQYLRCIIQAPEDMVETCVTSSIRKLQWLPNRLIIYGGQKKCSTRVQLMVMTIMIMVLEAVHLAGEIWWTRRKRKTDPDYGRSFSWVGLFRAVILGIGTPLVCALIIRTQFPENSLAAALGLYLLTPRAAPIIAFLSGIFLSKGFGIQTLLVDLVSAGAALVLYNLPLKVWTGPMASAQFSEGAPSTTFLYMGIYLATVPAGVVFFIYQLIILLAVFLLIWSMVGKNKGLAKAAGYLIGLWIIMWIWIVSFAVFAIAEVVWLAFYKKKNGGKFPVLEDLRGWFSREGSSLGFFLKRYVYWAWVIVSFAVAVGRWMFFNELLQLVGGAFCPDSLKGATAASILITWAAIVSNVLLKLQGLAL
ncbi:hypothetical protein BKA66DRAFT_608141 [Pyrenochaeta sp. MPI-SDFR-AT-0127]|nr:hypothetical protein BKA66DRAFT_608141 [Pyrenochaeta sp. MPI-SDFR-AT-0127]